MNKQMKINFLFHKASLAHVQMRDRVASRARNIIQHLTRDIGFCQHCLQRPWYICCMAATRGEYTENCLSHPAAAQEDWKTSLCQTEDYNLHSTHTLVHSSKAFYQIKKHFLSHHQPDCIVLFFHLFYFIFYHFADQIQNHESRCPRFCACSVHCLEK